MTLPTTIATDFLEQHFGMVHARILHQDDEARIVTVETEKIPQVLECAVVRFLPEVAARYPGIHARIVGGELMGKAFRSAGVAFARAELACFLRPLDNTTRHIFTATEGSVHLKYVAICVGPDREVYAHNLELYSPVVPWPSGYFGYEQHASSVDVLYALLSDSL